MNAEQRVALASKKHEKARSQLNEAIRQARAEGQSLRSIAEAAGLSHEQVRRIANS